VLSGQHVTRRFRELEIELVGGDERTLRRLERELRKAGATSGEQRPKLFRALDLEVPEVTSTAPKDASSTEALAITLAEHARRVLLHDPGTRLGSDPEELHKLRVSTRRLRAYLRAARPLLDPTWTKELRDELGWLGRSLGPARDLDVLVAYVTGELEALGDDADAGPSLLAELADERARARHQVVEAISSDRYLALLDRLDEIGSPALSGEQVPLTKLWQREWKRASKALDGLSDESTDEELHAARIKVKRARYAAELAAHELGKDGERFAEAAARLQDVLGEHQDASVAEERIRAWGERSSGVTAGLLVCRQHDRRAAARAALPKAAKKLRLAAKPLA
jgi:CHAD domain-containing protein